MNMFAIRAMQLGIIAVPEVETVKKISQGIEISPQN